jgi:hypothetical protein
VAARVPAGREGGLPHTATPSYTPPERAAIPCRRGHLARSDRRRYEAQVITVLSLLLGLLSCGVTFALYKRRKWAPRLTVMVQVPFTVYDLATHQYGFILISVATILTGIIAHHERHEIDPRLARAVHEKAHRIRAEDDLDHHEAAWMAAESLGVSRPEFGRI